MKILLKEEIDTKLNNLDDRWALVNGSVLERVFMFKNFDETVEFINRVANCADRYKKYPDLEITENKATVRISTKKLNGLVSQDFALAQSIDISEN